MLRSSKIQIQYRHTILSWAFLFEKKKFFEDGRAVSKFLLTQMRNKLSGRPSATEHFSIVFMTCLTGPRQLQVATCRTAFNAGRWKKSLRSRNCLCVCGVRRRGVAVLLMLVPGSSLLRKLSHKVPHTLSVSHPTQVHINRPTEAHPNINH